MTTSLPEFGFSTTAESAASALSSYIAGKTVLVTGISKGGLGCEAARAIALEKPKLLILAGRSAAKNNETKELIEKDLNTKGVKGVEIKPLQLDLGSFESIRKSAGTLNGWDWGTQGLDVLINNAAVMGNAEIKTSTDGIEEMFATNHLGPFLFTNLIINRILAAGPGARIVNVSSRGHHRSDIRYDDYNWKGEGAYTPLGAYGQSKTGNVLFSKSLADKLKAKGVLSFSLHPGGIMTNLSRSLDMKVYQEAGFLDENMKPIDSPGLKWKTLEQGASTTVVAAFDPRIEARNGYYLNDCEIDDEAVAPYAVDSANGEKLWVLSETLVGQEFKL